MNMPKPGPGHAGLERLAGTWEGEEILHPSHWDPKGGVALGRTTSRVALNGFALIGDYEQVREGVVTFSGYSVMTYDPAEERYMLHWFDCLGSPLEIFQGCFEGDVLTLSHGGPGMHARISYDLSEPDHLVSRMEMSQDGKGWVALFDGRYKRT